MEQFTTPASGETSKILAQNIWYRSLLKDKYGEGFEAMKGISIPNWYD